MEGGGKDLCFLGLLVQILSLGKGNTFKGNLLLALFPIVTLLNVDGFVENYILISRETSKASIDIILEAKYVEWYELPSSVFTEAHLQTHV